MASSKLFNVYFDSVVRPCISLMVDDRASVHDVLVHALGWRLGVFYTDGGLMGYWFPEWLQVYLNVLIGLFHRIVPAANFPKSNTINFQPG